MLRIRVSEKQAFAALERDDFIQRVRDVMRSSWAEAVEARGDAAVKALLDSWFDPLKQANIRSEVLVARAMNVFFALVCDFGEEPLAAAWVEQLMTEGRAAAGDNGAAARVDLLEQSLFERYDQANQHG